jgi:ADP-ribose pyrophosphatase YjhB (NUDIX family)
MSEEVIPPMATPRVAAGAIFLDDKGRVLLVKPSYKNGYDVPGGYVEPGESPRDACIREVREELGILPPIGMMLAVDWAPTQREGDKLLFLFDGGVLPKSWQNEIALQPDELVGWQFVASEDLAACLPPRLTRRVGAAVEARTAGRQTYLEHGVPPASAKGVSPAR